MKRQVKACRFVPLPAVFLLVALLLIAALILIVPFVLIAALVLAAVVLITLVLHKDTSFRTSEVQEVVWPEEGKVCEKEFVVAKVN